MTTILADLLKDSAYRLDQFKPEHIAALEAGITLKDSGKTTAPYVTCLVRGKPIKLTPEEAVTVRHVLLLCFIACVTLVALSALRIWVAIHLRRFRVDVEDNLLARKHVTQSRILQQVGTVLIIAVGVSAALMSFDGVRQYGVSLLASAGAAGLVAGLALQPVLRNLFAGIQLAITQPIRIDDAVIVEGEWGNIEEIGGTYVVVRIWDKRRLVVPLSYFMEQPFQNWTRKDASLIGVVMLYVDYAVDIPELRAEAERIVRASALWDNDVFALQVTDFRETVTEVRAPGQAAGLAFIARSRRANSPRRSQTRNRATRPKATDNRTRWALLDSKATGPTERRGTFRLALGRMMLWLKNIFSMKTAKDAVIRAR